MGNLDYGRWVPVTFGDIKAGLGCGQPSKAEPARPLKALPSPRPLILLFSSSSPNMALEERAVPVWPT